MDDILKKYQELLESAQTEDEIAEIHELFESDVRKVLGRRGTPNRSSSYNKNYFFPSHLGGSEGEGAGYRETGKMGQRGKDWGRKATEMEQDIQDAPELTAEDIKRAKREAANKFQQATNIRIIPPKDDNITKFKDDLMMNNSGEIYAVNDDDDVIAINGVEPTHRRGEQLFAEAGQAISDDLQYQFHELLKKSMQKLYDMQIPDVLKVDDELTFYNTQGDISNVAERSPELLDKLDRAGARSELRPSAQVHGPGIRSNKEAGTEYDPTFDEDSRLGPKTTREEFMDVSVPSDIYELEPVDKILRSLGQNVSYRPIFKLITTLNERKAKPDRKQVRSAIKELMSIVEPMKTDTVNKNIEALKTETDVTKLKSDIFNFVNFLNEFVFVNFFNSGTDGKLSARTVNAGLKKLLKIIETTYDNSAKAKGGTSAPVLRDNLLAVVDNILGKNIKYNNEGKIENAGDAVIPIMINKLVDALKDTTNA